MSDELEPIRPDEPGKKKTSPAPALFLAFLPSIVFLLFLSFAAGSNLSTGLLVGCFIISVICCFASSFMLFRRGTGLAIFGGVVFLLLNGVVSFFFGCGVILTQMKF